MTLHIYLRRILFFLAIICFLVMAPLIVLYAFGFRYDFEQKRITQVGMITVKSIPKTVNVFINDKLKAKRTYARIRDLIPKDYTVKLEKKGYISWEKKLTVGPKKVTAIKHARLFLKEPKISQLTTLGINDYFLSFDAQKIVYTISSGDETGIWLLDLTSGNTSKLFPKSKEEFTKVQEKITFSNIKWSFDSEKVLALYKTGLKDGEPSQTYHLVINIARPYKVIFLEDLFKFEIKDARWHPKNSNEIFWLNQGNLYKFNLDQKTLYFMLAIEVLDYALVNQDVYYISKTENKNTKPIFQLIKKNLSSLEEKVMANVSDMGVEEFCEIIAGEKRIAFRLGKDKSLYVLNKENKLQKLADKTQKVIWDTLQNKLIYQNDYEIYVVRFFDEDFEIELEPQIELITRYSEKIQDCAWYPSYQHIIFSVKNTIKIIELDGRDKRNVYEFGEIKTLPSNLSCNPEGKIVYFLNEKDQAKNIFQAKIY